MFRFQFTVLCKYTFAVLSFGVMSYFITLCVRQYFSYPTQTRVSIVLNHTQLFPALTICSGNPLRFDKFLGPLLGYIRANNLSASPPTITRDDIYYGAFNYVADLFNQNRTQQLMAYGFQLEDILLDCSYNGFDCRSMWTRTISPVLGNCYTFNRQTLDPTTTPFRMSDVNGQNQVLNNGLKITFYLNIELYFPILEYGLGLTGILHNPDEQPLIRYSGKRFSPGFEHTLVYEKSVSTYLGAPYTACTDLIRDDMKALYSLFDGNTDYIYSETVCLELCQQTYMFEQCGCIFPVYFYLNRLIIQGQLQWVRGCTPWSAEYKCTIQARQRIAIDRPLQESRCPHCQSQCSIVKYAADQSSLKGPSDSQKNYYRNLILANSTIPVLPDFAVNSSLYLDRNYMKISVVPLNSYITVYDERATYSWSAFISDLGGQSGLWMGVSALSLLALVEYFYQKWQKMRAKKKSTAVQAFETKPPVDGKH